MTISIEEAGSIRDKLHNLDLNNSEHQKIYDDTFFYIVITSEGKEFKPYPDSKNKRTVGYGFNMDDGKTSRKFWYGAFGDSIDFDEVYQSKRPLSPDEAMTLYIHVRDVKRDELKRLFAKEWGKLKANEKMMLEDLCYNGGYSMIGKGTNFYRHMMRYIATSDPEHLTNALLEIRDRSNDARGTPAEAGIQNRRNAQYTLGNSIECPWYRKPHQSPLPASEDKREVVLGKTIIPHKHGIENCNYLDQLYIWRTCSDSKVRSSHLANEGKIFSTHNPPSTGHPGEDYNCRCSADYNIPDYVEMPKHKMFDERLLHKDSLEQ